MQNLGDNAITDCQEHERKNKKRAFGYGVGLEPRFEADGNYYEGEAPKNGYADNRKSGFSLASPVLRCELLLRKHRLPPLLAG